MVSPKHIVFTGPESTGKSTLAKRLVGDVGGLLVDEYAREYLMEHGLDYSVNDIKAIAFGQFSRQLSALREPVELVVSDTCVLTCKIWQEKKYGFVDPFITEWMSLQQIDCYLVCKPDLPWENDPMRESKYDLEELFHMYVAEIQHAGVPYRVISGRGEDRYQHAKSCIRQLGFL